MGAFLVRRLIEALLVILLVTIIVFLAVRFLPGNPMLVYVSEANLTSLTPEQLHELEHQFGVD